MDNAEKMREIDKEIISCTNCPLHLSRNNAVPGEGPAPARLMLIGEGPGKREDELGKPFVGRAGSILDELLASVGIERKEVFITSVVKCRPPGNRDPTGDEISACMPYLLRQIRLVSPAVIVPMGRFATASLFSHFDLKFESLGKVRRKTVLLPGGTIVFPVYHPAVITHNPAKKEELEEDFTELRKLIDLVL